MNEFLMIKSEVFSRILITSLTFDKLEIENEKSLVLEGNSDIGV